MIGIIGAMDVEINLLLEKLENQEVITINDYKFYKGALNNQDVVIVKCGVGKVNAGIVATIMALEFKPRLVISTGIAGGISPLKPKDVLLAEKFIYGDFDVRVFGYKYGQVPGENEYFFASDKYLVKVEHVLKSLNASYHRGLSITSDKFISNMADVLVDTKNEYAVTEMESTAIAHALSHAEIPMVALRFVSDIIGEASQINDYMEFEQEMANLSANICLNCLGELWNITL